MKLRLRIFAGLVAMGVSIGSAALAQAPDLERQKMLDRYKKALTPSISLEEAKGEWPGKGSRLDWPRPYHFQVVSDGVLDHQQNVVWAAADSGRKLSWDDAVAYCSSRGPGWRLPGQRLLQSLYDPRSQFTKTLKINTMSVWIFPATNLIRMTGIYYWTGKIRTPAPYVVSFSHGDRVKFTHKNQTMHALCVRSL